MCVHILRQRHRSDAVPFPITIWPASTYTAIAIVSAIKSSRQSYSRGAYWIIKNAPPPFQLKVASHLRKTRVQP